MNANAVYTTANRGLAILNIRKPIFDIKIDFRDELDGYLRNSKFP